MESRFKELNYRQRWRFRSNLTCRLARMSQAPLSRLFFPIFVDNRRCNLFHRYTSNMAPPVTWKIRALVDQPSLQDQDDLYPGADHKDTTISNMTEFLITRSS